MDKLEYVLTLAEERNLTRAAARLFISQPTLTNYINRLESELGIKLFDRSVQPIRVTEAGRIYIEDKKKIQNRELALRTKLDSLKHKDHTFTIGAPPVRSAFDLPMVIEKFMRLYPDINVHIDNRLEEELEKDVMVGKIDVAIGALSMTYSGIHYECIHEDQMCLLIPRSFACVAGLSEDEGTVENPYLLDGSCLNQMTMLMSRPGGGHYRIAMIMMEKYGIVPKNTIQCSSVSLLYQLVGEGIGFLFTTPVPFMKPYSQYTDRIAFCTLQREKIVQKSYIGYLNDNPNSKMVQEFVRIMKESKQVKKEEKQSGGV